MLTKESIERTLSHHYTKETLKAGYSIYLNEGVDGLDEDIIESLQEDFDNGEDPEFFMWVYDEDYGEKEEILFYFDYEDHIWYGDCNCENDYCKHEVAGLHELKDFIATGSKKSISRPKRGTKRGRKSAKVRSLPSAIVSSTPKAKDNSNVLSGDSTAEYRLLPLTNNNILTALKRYAPKRYPTFSWNEKFEGIFLSENEMKIESLASYGFYGFEKQEIVIKLEDKKLYVKCLTCDQKIKILCKHQATLLDATAHILEQENGFLKDQDGFYNRIVKQTSKKSGVDLEAFEKYFTIKMGRNGFSILGKVDNLHGSEWIKSTQEYLDSEQEYRKHMNKIETTKLGEGRAKKQAYFWGLKDGLRSNTTTKLHFVRGNGLKTKEGIQSSSWEVDGLPTGFPKEALKLGQKLYFAIRDENANTRFEQAKKLIQKNLSTLNSIYQYTYSGDIEYGRKPKAAQLAMVKFQPGILSCRFEILRKDGLVNIKREITLDGEPFDYTKVNYSNEVFSATRTQAFCHANEHFSGFMNLFNGQDMLIVPFTNKKEYTKLVSGFRQHFAVTVPKAMILKEEILPDPVYQILLREVGQFVLFEPQLKYGDYSFNAFDKESYHIEKKIFRPNEEDRVFLIDFLKNAHPAFTSHNYAQAQDYVYLDVKELLNNYWFIHFNEACAMAGVEVLGQKNLTQFKYSTNRAVTFSHVTSGIDWFDVDMGVSFGDENIKTADWIKALRNKESFVRLKDGTLGVLPEEWLKQARKILAVADIEKGELKISKYRYNIIEDLFEDIDDTKIVEELKAKKKNLEELELNKKYKVPKIVKAKLRNYQEHGYAWLKFLDESQFGGILADDMGLGKTLQVISLLADQIKAVPSLVIVPRSLLFNWAAEIDKFCPKLKYIIHHGPSRSKITKDLLAYNVIITTYDTASSDIELLKDFKFNYIILDESQAIKNPDSKRYKAMRLLQSNNKLAMTGTPIENNTMDLYAQLSFTSPGLLGTKTSFKNDFAIPIDNNGDQEAANLLRKLIHPFLLRRTKDQVAKDLPDKTESIIYCEMGVTQRKLYTNLKRKIKEDIETAVEEKGVNKSKFQMLDGLLRLRQMCNSPLLVNSTFSGANADSVKVNILLEHLQENLGGHNALVFSQFVSLLTIVRKELDKRGISYAYLDGSTTKRQKEVDKFMDNEEVKIFLISIKAGNTGMNLTKADYVYILDPWWNPAVEAQAIDRTHRIGQDKQVFAYKLICKDSIEEKILKLQEKKKKLATDIIRTDENVLKSLDKVELMSLFD
ncbi:MAG: superfamily II DNA or RNA helicase [Polaribacter sp.]